MDGDGPLGRTVLSFDALLVLSFGGPEAPGHVMPFLENVTRGRGIPRERLASVAEHYLHFGGVSPINAINRALISAIEAEIDLPVYFGNRNWAPYVADTVASMRDNGIRRAAVFATSAWGGYSSCTQYVEDIARARTAAGGGADGARRRSPGVHRALDSSCGPIPLRPRPVQQAGGPCLPPGRHGRGL